MAKHHKRAKRRGRPSKGSARATIAKAISLLEKAKSKIHIFEKNE